MFQYGKGKAKFTLERAMKAQKGLDVLPYSLFTLGAKCGWVVNATPGRLTPGKGSRYPLRRRLDEPQDRSGRILQYEGRK